MLMKADAPTSMRSDDELLRACTEPDAMEELVRRFAPMVYAAARRQVRDAETAEDVLQNVFVTFARRAGELRSGVAVGAWLLRTTRYTAANARKTQARRRRHEQAASMQRSEVSEAETEEQSWREIAPLLDEAVAGLSGNDQTAVVLRFFRGLSLREIAGATGSTEEAARKRLTRAVERLRDRLTRAGVSPTACAAPTLTALLAHRGVEIVPAQMAAATASAATASAANASVASTSVIHGVLAMTAITKVAVAGGLVVLIVFSGVGALYLSGFGPRPAEPAPIAIAPPPATEINPVAPAPVAGNSWKPRFMAAYQLTTGQSIKRLAPPFIPERQQWYQATLPFDFKNDPNPSQIIFREGGDGILAFQILDGNDDFRSICLNVGQLRAWQINGDASLLNRTLSGDFVYRGGAPVDQVLSQLREIASQQFGRPVYLNHIHADRDVVVVSGELLPELGKMGSPKILLEMTAGQIAAHLDNGGGNFKAKGGGVDFLLDNLSEATETPFIDERGVNSPKMIEFGAVEINDPAASGRGIAADEKLLNSLNQQTGLTFTTQRRTVNTWTLSLQP
jgi:RNA polymerase sigma factor (sigma-70 family)